MCAMARQGSRIMWSYAGLLMHNANLVFVLFDMWLNKLTLEPNHRYFVLLFGLSYQYFATIFNFYTGVWYYFFLDTDKPVSIIGYPGNLVFWVFLFDRLVRWQRWPVFGGKQSRGGGGRGDGAPSAGGGAVAPRTRSAKTPREPSNAKAARSRSPGKRAASRGRSSRQG